MSTGMLPVPPGTRLLHIGPHKTGTSGLQAAFHRAREQLVEHGVGYAGREKQPAHAAAFIAGGEPPDLERPTLAHWEALCAEVAAAGGRRVVISSERFSNAGDHAARAVVDGLGGASVHVAVTLRPLLKILPSQWQENIQGGASYSYEEWLERMLRHGLFKPTSKFWRRHRHDALVERWGGVVGFDNLTVVVADDADPPMLLRAFEKLVGLPSGLLVPEPRIANRSLTLGEVELMRRFNVELERCSWLTQPQRKVIRESVRRSMRKGYTPAPDEARIITPDWVVAAAAEVAREMVENISKLGVRVIGDLSLLTWTPPGPAKLADLPRVPSFVAADAVLGAVLATWPPKPSPLPVAPGDRPVRKVRSLDLLRVLGRRALRRVRRRLRRRPTADGDRAAGGR